MGVWRTGMYDYHIPLLVEFVCCISQDSCRGKTSFWLCIHSVITGHLSVQDKVVV